MLNFHDPTKKLYQTGLDRGVLYVRDATGNYPTGVVWNGLISVKESPSGAEPTDLYASNEKYLTLISKEVFGGTIEAYTYPDEFGVCDGSAAPVPGMTLTQQNRATFGMAYRSKIGSEVGGPDLGYLIHLVYGATVTPSDRSRNTINATPEAVTFSWDFSTTPVASPTGFAPTAKIVLDSTKLTAAQLLAVEKVLYGDDQASPAVVAHLPLPADLHTIITSA